MILWISILVFAALAGIIYWMYQNDFDMVPALFILGGGLVIIGLIGWVLVECVYECYVWANVPQFEHHATLLSDQYNPSTLSSHVAPTFNGEGGISFTYYSTGHGESYITIWDCGCYGRLKCDKQEVFQYAKPKSILYLKKLNNDIRIVGIKHEQ